MDLSTYKQINKTKIIHFVANWCIASKQNEQLLKEYVDHVHIIDYDQNPEIVKYENITKIPTILYKDYRIEGVSLYQLKKLLKSFHLQ